MRSAVIDLQQQSPLDVPGSAFFAEYGLQRDRHGTAVCLRLTVRIIVGSSTLAGSAFAHYSAKGEFIAELSFSA